MSSIEFIHDHLRNSDRRALRRKHCLESREVIVEQEVEPGVTLVASRVRAEVWHYHGDQYFPKGLVFNVRGIKDDIVSGEIDSHVIRIKITEEFYRHTLTNGGVEEQHVRSLNSEDLDRIAVGVLMPGDTLMLIDGNHRLARRYRDGMTDMRVVVVRCSACREHLALPEQIGMTG